MKIEKNLLWFPIMMAEKKNRRYLFQYNFLLEHSSGPMHNKVDGLFWYDTFTFRLTQTL